MSKGDTLIGIKNNYKGVEFKSKLESKIAFLLDLLKIKWTYEPQLFLLSDGTYYKPDFYLPELKMWIEGKGVIKKHNKEISRRFVKEYKTELLLISQHKTWWFSTKDFNDGLNEDDLVLIKKCSYCNSYSLVSNNGFYFCRKCNGYDGDHDICGGLNPEILESAENIKKILKEVLKSDSI